MTKTALTIAMIISAAASPAFAGDSGERTRTVSYADLDLSASAGIAAFDRRIAQAVKQVCGDAELVDLKAMKGLRNCRVNAKAGADRQRSAVLAARKSDAIRVAAR